MCRVILAGLSVLICFTASAVEPLGGWRGNGTGLWTQGKPPLTWHRIPKGAMEGMRAQVDRPANDQPGDVPLVEKGQVREWLVLGPFQVTNSVTEFDNDLLDGEAAVQPTTDDKQADRTWKSAKLVAIDDPNVFGTAEAPWLDLAAEVGFKQHQLAYAHTWLYSPRGGKVRLVADHTHGLKAWMNGKEVGREPERKMVLGYYTNLSRMELEHSTASASCFNATMEKGWNRLLLKVSTPGPNGHQEMRLNLRIMDPPDVPYDSENIAWMTELPGAAPRPRSLWASASFSPRSLICSLASTSIRASNYGRRPTTTTRR